MQLIRKLVLGLAMVTPLAFSQTSGMIDLPLSPTPVCNVTLPTTIMAASPTYLKNGEQRFLSFENTSQSQGKVLAFGYGRVEFNTTYTTAKTTFVGTPTAWLALDAQYPDIPGSLKTFDFGKPTFDLEAPFLNFRINKVVIHADTANKGFRESQRKTDMTLTVSCLS